jgi:AsmA protein
VFGVQNGAIVGIDLKKTPGAVAKVKSLETLADFKPSPGDRTSFTHFGGTAKVTKGVIRNKDLRIKSPGLVSVTGKGSVDVVRKSLDYTITIGRLPVRISGPFSSLSYKLDVTPAVEAEVETKVEKQKKKLEQNLRDQLLEKINR